MPEEESYGPIIEKLVAKTQAGRVPWQLVETEDEEVFSADLEDGLRFEISKVAFPTGTSFVLVMKDGHGSEIMRVVARGDKYGLRIETYYTELEQLYTLARKRALQIDEKLERAASILDRM